MPKYHFDLVASKTIADEGGAEVCNDIGAMDIAQELARRLVKERPELKDRHYAILSPPRTATRSAGRHLIPSLKKRAGPAPIRRRYTARHDGPWREITAAIKTKSAGRRSKVWNPTKSMVPATS
jgi:hypothetical protein